MKTRPLGAELFHTDGQTVIQMEGITNLIVAFPNFPNAPKKAGNVMTFKCICETSLPWKSGKY